ncbi:hypothetical protein MRX96_020661 [Rhipicephalus microplus]
MVSEEDRVHTDCKCIESALMAKSLNGSQRTVACFLDSDVLKENAEFEVVVKDEVVRVSANAIEGTYYSAEQASGGVVFFIAARARRRMANKACI